MLRLILDGEPGTIRFEAFLRAMAAMLDGVRDVDRALSGGDRPRLDWVLDRLENSSAGAVVRDRPGGDVPPKHGLRVRARFVRQLRVLAERAGVPPDFTLQTVEALAESARLLGDGGGTAIRAVDLESGEATALTEDVRETIRRILSPRYTSVGSVTGTLDTIRRRSGMYATVFEELHGRAVRCGFEEDLLSQVKEAFGQRVIARGIVHYNDETGVSRVDLRELEVLPDAERLPSVAQMYGSIPDFTGGLDSVEYVRQLRDE